jgi:sugar transferase (PEP-CTERM system associated)
LISNKLPKKQFILLVGDIIWIIVSFYLVPVLRFGVFLDPSVILGWPDLTAIFIYLLSFYIFDFYNLEEPFNTAGYVLRFLVALVVADLFITTIFYTFNVRPYSTVLLLLNTLLIFSLCLGWRFLHGRWCRKTRRAFRTLVVGAGCAGKALHEMLARRDDFVIVGFLDDDPAKCGADMGTACVLGETKLLPTLLAEVDVVIVAITHNMSRDLYKQLVDVKMRGVTVYEMPTFYERVLGKIPVNHVSDPWLVSVPISGVQINIYNQKIKKVLDKFLSLAGFILTFPIALLTAVAIKLDSKGPIFYRQARVGRDGRSFELVKFRSMEINAEVNGAVWAQKNDPRVTRVGKIIRILRFDEIPQFWNVLGGEMSLVGPRPERPEFVKELIEEIPYYSLRHAVAPGITGWAQVNCPYGASKEDALAKLEYDLYYIKNLSPLLDLLILARTVQTVLFGKGAR